MADLFSLSDQVLKEGNSDAKPFGRINHELSELDDGLSFVEAFSNTVNFATDDGLIVVATESSLMSKGIFGYAANESDTFS